MADATLHLTGELLLQLIPPIDHIVERARDSSPPRRARAGREGRQLACLLSTRSEARRDMAEASRALPGRLADSEQAMDPEALAQARALHASLAQTFALDGQSPLEGTTAARLCEEHRVHDRAVRALIERLPQGSTMGCEWRHVLEAIRGRLDHLVAAALARPPLGGDWHWPTGEARSARAATGCLDASETLRYNIAAMVGLLRRLEALIGPECRLPILGQQQWRRKGKRAVPEAAQGQSVSRAAESMRPAGEAIPVRTMAVAPEATVDDVVPPTTFARVRSILEPVATAAENALRRLEALEASCQSRPITPTRGGEPEVSRSPDHAVYATTSRQTEVCDSGRMVASQRSELLVEHEARKAVQEPQLVLKRCPQVEHEARMAVQEPQQLQRCPPPPPQASLPPTAQHMTEAEGGGAMLELEGRLAWIRGYQGAVPAMDWGFEVVDDDEDEATSEEGGQADDYGGQLDEAPSSKTITEEEIAVGDDMEEEGGPAALKHGGDGAEELCKNEVAKEWRAEVEEVGSFEEFSGSEYGSDGGVDQHRCGPVSAVTAVMAMKAMEVPLAWANHLEPDRCSSSEDSVDDDCPQLALAAGPSPQCDEAALDDGLRHSDSADEAAPHLESEGAAKVVISAIARAVRRAVVTVAVASVLRGVVNAASPPTPEKVPQRTTALFVGSPQLTPSLAARETSPSESLDWEETYFVDSDRPCVTKMEGDATAGEVEAAKGLEGEETAEKQVVGGGGAAAASESEGGGELKATETESETEKALGEVGTCEVTEAAASGCVALCSKEPVQDREGELPSASIEAADAPPAPSLRSGCRRYEVLQAEMKLLREAMAAAQLSEGCEDELERLRSEFEALRKELAQTQSAACLALHSTAPGRVMPSQDAEAMESASGPRELVAQQRQALIHDALLTSKDDIDIATSCSYHRESIADCLPSDMPTWDSLESNETDRRRAQIEAGECSIFTYGRPGSWAVEAIGIGANPTMPQLLDRVEMEHANCLHLAPAGAPLPSRRRVRIVGV